jgi:hypothetical protein
MIDLFHLGMCVDKCPTSATDKVVCVPNKYIDCKTEIKARASHPLLNICIPNITKADAIRPET